VAWSRLRGEGCSNERVWGAFVLGNRTAFVLQVRFFRLTFASRSDSGASLGGHFAAGFGATSVDASKCFDCRIQSRQLVLHMITFFFQLPDNP
jgi:hypothetical protein